MASTSEPLGGGPLTKAANVPTGVKATPVHHCVATSPSKAQLSSWAAKRSDARSAVGSEIRFHSLAATTNPASEAGTTQTPDGRLSRWKVSQFAGFGPTC